MYPSKVRITHNLQIIWIFKTHESAQLLRTVCWLIFFILDHKPKSFADTVVENNTKTIMGY